MKYSLLVFDWDGTLMDSTGRIVSSLHAAICDTGAEPREDAALRDIIGLGLVEAVQALYPDAGGGFVGEFAEAYRRHFLDEDPTPSTLYPGVIEVIDRLEAEGFLLGVATGKARLGLERVLVETGLVGRFHATRCADETRSKPHPQMLEEVMDVTGVGPRESLVIGDSEYDMLMAGAAGVDRLGVSCGVHDAERLLACGALACLRDVRELPEWLGLP